MVNMGLVPWLVLLSASVSSLTVTAQTLRLVGGGKPCAGRIEVYVDGQWGTVCDDSWDLMDAQVVCRQMGCGRAESAHSSALFGQGTGKILMDDVNCRGDEKYLIKCPFRGKYDHNCGHHEDAGVTCSGYSPQPDFEQVTVPNNSTESAGYVEDTASVWKKRPCSEETKGEHFRLNGKRCVWGKAQESFGHTCQEGAPMTTEPENDIGVPMTTELGNDIGSPMTTEPGNDIGSPMTTEPGNDIATTSANNPVVNCGGILTNSRGYISMASDVSSASEYCVWFINNPSNNRIQLTFNTFIRRSSQACRMSSVYVYDGTPGTSVLLGDLCKTATRTFVSTLNSLSVLYSSWLTGQDLEFSASYSPVISSIRNVSVSCHSDFMNVLVSRGYLASLGYSADDVYLNDPQCRPNVRSGWLEFHIPYENCSTEMQVENDTISYSNTLSTYSTRMVVIYRKKLNLAVKCRLYRDAIAESVYQADDTMHNALIQYGLYSASLNFYRSSGFTRQVKEFPYYVDLNQQLFLEAALVTSDPDLVLFIDTCIASPNDKSFNGTVYQIVYNGCGRAPGYTSYSTPTSSKARFGFDAFTFLKKHSSVYIQCKLVVCQNGSEWSRCSQGCLTRQKRAAVPLQHEEIHVMAGPVTLLY